MAKQEFTEQDRAEARKTVSEVVTSIGFVRVFCNEAKTGSGDLMVEVLIEELQKLLPAAE